METLIIAFAAGALFGAIGSYFYTARDDEELPEWMPEPAPPPPPRTFTNLTHRERTIA